MTKREELLAEIARLEKELERAKWLISCLTPSEPIFEKQRRKVWTGWKFEWIEN